DGIRYFHVTGVQTCALPISFGNEEDLDWAIKIYDWQKRMLVDPVTGFVWDGMNREGDGKIDKDWKFTYCQGVYIGAGLELYRHRSEERRVGKECRSTRSPPG